MTLRHNEPAGSFANQVAAYGYRVMRYLTLNENHRPFPFSDFPAAIELPTWRSGFRLSRGPGRATPLRPCPLERFKVVGA